MAYWREIIVGYISNTKKEGMSNVTYPSWMIDDRYN